MLAEEALGGPAALVATPVQKVAGGVARAVNAPVRFWANTVNNAVDTVKHAGEETSDRFSAVTDRAAALTDAVRETLTAGRSASLRRAEQVASREGNKDAAKAAKSAREELGDVSADELPIKNYDNLTVGDAIKAIKGLKDAARHPRGHPLRGGPQGPGERGQRRADPAGRRWPRRPWASTLIRLHSQSEGPHPDSGVRALRASGCPLRSAPPVAREVTGVTRCGRLARPRGRGSLRA